MKKVHGKPITGAKPQMRAKAPVKTDANKPSLQAEQIIKRPPQPFANPFGTVALPTKHGGPGVEPGPVNKLRSGIKAKPIGQGLPQMRAVGQTRPISHAGNVFGRFGTSHPKKAGSQNLGKAKKNARFYGEN